MNTAERLFYEDIRIKRKTGSGSFHKKGKGVKHGISGGIKTPYDYMTTKERKKLNGAVIVSNMYSLCDYELFKSYSDEKKIDILNKWRNVYKTKEIMEALGLKQHQYYKICYDLGVIEKPESEKAKEVKNPQNNNQKPNAMEDDILPWNDFNLLSNEEKLQWLEDYNHNFNMHSVAEIWGKPINSIYSLKYTLKKRVEKSSEPKMVAIEPRAEVDHVEEEERNDQQEVEETIMEAVKERDEVTGMNREELEDLKKLVFAQSHLLSQLVESQKEQVHLAAVGGAVENVTRKVTRSESDGFVLKYNAEKEGFMMFAEISRLLSVLQKNPDMFQAEIVIKKISE